MVQLFLSFWLMWKGVSASQFHNIKSMCHSFRIVYLLLVFPVPYQWTQIQDIEGEVRIIRSQHKFLIFPHRADVCHTPPFRPQGRAASWRARSRRRTLEDQGLLQGNRMWRYRWNISHGRKKKWDEEKRSLIVESNWSSLQGSAMRTVVSRTQIITLWWTFEIF